MFNRIKKSINGCYFKICGLLNEACNKWQDNEGSGVIEVVLIIVVVVGLVLIFKNKLQSLANQALNSISSDVDSIVR